MSESNNYNNIPGEMRTYHQWVVWRYEEREGAKPTKVPYNPVTGRTANVTDPSTWVSYDDAVRAAQGGQWAGVGFVLTEHDPYTFIDLDDAQGDDAAYQVQLKIYQMFDSYAERSPSGTGLHVIVKGHMPSGRRRGKIEAYSSERYMTMTGDVYRDAPIREYQTYVSTLWHELGGHIETYTYGGDMVEKLTDAEVVAKAMGAVNGEKFAKLHSGDWQNDYPSQSEADQAYMNFLAFYSQHRIQLMRLFRASPLGQREKAMRTGYLNYTINRAFDKMLPPVDMDGFRNKLSEDIAALDAEERPAPSIDLSAQIARAHATPAPVLTAPAPVGTDLPPEPPIPPSPAKSAIPVPPGMVGELAKFIYNSAPRPVPEIALAGALGLFAGVCGRSFNVSRTGLNNYFLMLAPTGTGKEAMQAGIEKFMSYVMSGGMLGGGDNMGAVPAAKEFLGPAEIASGQALIKRFGVQRSFVSVVGEFGLTMQRLSHPRASSSEITLKKVLLDLYNKSGQGNVLRPTVYSDKDKNTDDVAAPALTILGESTPESYYSNLDEGLISDGLLPRFTTFEYHGPRPPFNRDHASVVPSLQLVDWFAALSDTSLKLNAHNQALDVAYTSEAEAFLHEVDRYADDEINNSDREVIKQLWNRAHIKTLKLAALVAVGCVDFNSEQQQPVITLEVAQWAYDIISRDVRSITRKFEMGEVGNNSEESKQVTDLVAAVVKYVRGSYEDIKKYGPSQELHDAKVIPYQYLQRKLVALASFRHDRVGSTNAIKRTIAMLIDEGALVEVGRADMQKHNARGRGYMISDTHRFLTKKGQ